MELQSGIYPDDQVTVIVPRNLNGSGPGELAAELTSLSH